MSDPGTKKAPDSGRTARAAKSATPNPRASREKNSGQPRQVAPRGEPAATEDPKKSPRRTAGPKSRKPTAPTRHQSRGAAVEDKATDSAADGPATERRAAPTAGAAKRGATGKPRTQAPAAPTDPPRELRALAEELAALKATIAPLTAAVESLTASRDSEEGPTTQELDRELAIAAMVHQQQALVVRLSQMAQRATSVDVVRAMTDQALREVRVRRVETIEDPLWFPGVDDPTSYDVMAPAYVDLATSRLIQAGVAVERPTTTTTDPEPTADIVPSDSKE